MFHGIDYEKRRTTSDKHGLLSEEMLQEKTSEEIVRAIKAHNAILTKIQPESRMEKDLIASDAVSGLLVACSLVMPSEKLAQVKVENAFKKFRDKDFARGASRNRILICEETGFVMNDFLEIALETLKGPAQQMGL